jgi:Na+-driven multidrug efflux pump
VLAEAVASRFMARRAVAGLLARPAEIPPAKEPLTVPRITRFYAPLALMSVLGLAAHPMVVFFLGHSRFAIESLAVVPVVNGLVFLFRCLGLSFQELAIALLGEHGEHYREIRRFGILLGALASLGLGAIVLTPLAEIWFLSVAGLTPELAQFAIAPARILVLMPAITVIMSFQRAILVEARNTTPVTWSTAADLLAMAAVLTLAIDVAGMTGATAAALALFAGRLVDTLYLIPATSRGRRKP